MNAEATINGETTFNPVDFGFEWTDDGWYRWDHRLAHAAALSARNGLARKLKKEGRPCRKFSVSSQLITKGGIGSGHPQIELVVNVYGVRILGNTD